MKLSERPIWLLPVIAALISGALAAWLIVYGPLAQHHAGDQPRTAPVRVSGEAQLGGPFTLTNHLGETVTEADFQGRPMLIYFGFTFCPDTCPMSLQTLGSALDRLPPEEAAHFQALLITVDPERDTPEALADYVIADVFPDNLMGLTGTEAQIRDVARHYRVSFQRIEDDNTVADYLIDHTSAVFLMDGEGQFADIFPHNTAPAEMAARLQLFLEENPIESDDTAA